MFWNLIQDGKEPPEIVIELGIDPDILREYRVNGLKGMIRNEVRAGKGFRDLKTYGSYLKDYTDPEAKVKYLEQQLAYKDQEIEFLIIQEAYRFRGYDKGARGIYMRLLHMNPPVHMNIKKIRRLMNKYGLLCPIRKANPYRRMAKALRTSNVAPNLLNREFETHRPRAVLLTLGTIH